MPLPTYSVGSRSVCVQLTFFGEAWAASELCVCINGNREAFMIFFCFTRRAARLEYSPAWILSNYVEFDIVRGEIFPAESAQLSFLSY